MKASKPAKAPVSTPLRRAERAWVHVEAGSIGQVAPIAHGGRVDRTILRGRQREKAPRAIRAQTTSAAGVPEIPVRRQPNEACPQALRSVPQ